MASQKIRKSLQTIMCLAGTSLASICYSQGKDYKIVISSEIPAPQLIYPKDGETVDANNLVLDWENIPKASK